MVSNTATPSRINRIVGAIVGLIGGAMTSSVAWPYTIYLAWIEARKKQYNIISTIVYAISIGLIRSAVLPFCL